MGVVNEGRTSFVCVSNPEDRGTVHVLVRTGTAVYLVLLTGYR